MGKVIKERRRVSKRILVSRANTKAMWVTVEMS